MADSQSSTSSSSSIDPTDDCLAILSIMKTDPEIAAWSNIWNISYTNNLPIAHVEEGAMLIADYVKKSSVMTKAKLAQEIATLPIPQAVYLTRRFVAHGISIDTCLSRPDPDGGIMKFKKPELRYPKCFGSNRRCRLARNLNDRSNCWLDMYNVHALVEEVFMGNNHTMFRMSTGEIFGCGLAVNFLDDHFDGDKKHAVVKNPKRLRYVKAKNLYHKNCVTVTDTSTIFGNASRRCMVIGDDETLEVDQVEMCGPNWKEVRVRHPIEESVQIVLDGKRITIFPKPAKWTTVGQDRAPISALINGKRVDHTLLEERLQVSTDGQALLCIDELLYQGKLYLAPEQEGDKKILVAILEELNLPFPCHAVRCSPDGKSRIVLPSSSEWEECNVNSLDCITRLTDVFVTEYLKRPFDQGPVNYIRGMMIDYKRVMDVAKDSALNAYDYSGFPCKNFRHVLTFFTLADLLTPEAGCSLPAVLTKEYTVEFKEALKNELEASTRRSNKTIHLYEDDGTLLSRVEAMIEAKGEIIWNALEAMVQIEDESLLETKLPALVDLACQYFKCLTKRDVLTGSARRTYVTEGKGPIELVIEERIANGHIDENDERFKLIEVHATGIRLYAYDEWDFRHFIFTTNTTKALVQLIEPQLIDFYHPASNKINLNEACRDDADPKRFRRLIEELFLVSDYRNLQSDIPIGHLAPEELYTITSLDGMEVKVPKILFEVYSNGFDARIREKSSNQFHLEYPAKVIKAAALTMIGNGSFDNFDRGTKSAVLRLFNECLITQLATTLVKKSITSADYNDPSCLQEMFLTFYNKEIEEFLVNTRPDIVLFWNLWVFPGGESVQEYERLVNKVQAIHFCHSEPSTLERAALTDTNKICTEWLSKMLDD